MQTASKLEPQIAYHKPSGLWWPTNCSADDGFAYMIRRVTDIDVAVKHCRKTAVAVQAGGNVGMWPLRLANIFSCVHTFEPVPRIFSALSANIERVTGIIAHNELLSDEPGRIIPFDIQSGGTSRAVAEVGKANSSFTATTIDALNLPCCDAIFLDVEGHELSALAGARETIRQYKPIVTLEAWNENVKNYCDAMIALGYVSVAKVHGDYIFAPRKP